MTVDRAALRAQIERHEGLRLHPYADGVGKLTIGYGRNLTTLGISREEAAQLLDHDLAACDDVFTMWPWLADLDPVRQQVVLDMRFQLGLAGLAAFHEFLAALEARDFTGAAAQMMRSHWAQQVPHRAQELATMMESGEQAP